MAMPDTFLRKRDVLKVTGLSKSTLYREINEGSFPKPKQITRGSVAWSAAEIAAWQDSCPTSNMRGNPGPSGTRGGPRAAT